MLPQRYSDAAVVSPDLEEPPMIRLVGALLLSFAFASSAYATEGAALVVTAHQREHVFATGGNKLCPFGTCVPPRPGASPPRGPITDGAGNP